MTLTDTDAALDQIDLELSRHDILDSRRVRLTLERRRLTAEPADAALSEPGRTIGFDERRRIVSSWQIFRTGRFGPPADAFTDAELAVLSDELFAAEIADHGDDIRAADSTRAQLTLAEPARGDARFIRDAHGSALLIFSGNSAA